MNCPKCHYEIPAALIVSEHQRTIASRPRPGRIGLAPHNRILVTCAKCGMEMPSSILQRRSTCPHLGRKEK